jgi:two-component system, chemotaxis family, protein-glutamate methylesterase/glutaminase
MPNTQYSVLIVNASTTARAMLRKLVETDPALQVMGLAPDAQSAVRQMQKSLPDVLLLDLDMPGVNGFTFLKKIMAQRPMPVVVCSPLVREGSEGAASLLEAGAVDAVPMPDPANVLSYKLECRRVCDALRSGAINGPTPDKDGRARPTGPKVSPDVLLPLPSNRRPVPVTEPIVFIGASTGGTEALREVLAALPADAPAIAVVQHMPHGFTGAFARRMDSLCKIKVQEATTNMVLTQGMAIIAPGDQHLIIRRLTSGYRAEVIDGPHISRHRPSVDMLFRSGAICAGPNALGIIMTGMGDDGAHCLGEMRRAGATTFAQDEASSVVFGMPREALELGSAMKALPLNKIASHIMTFAHRHRNGAAV